MRLAALLSRRSNVHEAGRRFFGPWRAFSIRHAGMCISARFEGPIQSKGLPGSAVLARLCSFEPGLIFVRASSFSRKTRPSAINCLNCCVINASFIGSWRGTFFSTRTPNEEATLGLMQKMHVLKYNSAIQHALSKHSFMRK